MDIENEWEANVSKGVYTQAEPVENYKVIYEQLRNDHVKLKEERQIKENLILSRCKMTMNVYYITLVYLII